MAKNRPGNRAQLGKPTRPTAAFRSAPPPAPIAVDMSEQAVAARRAALADYRSSLEPWQAALVEPAALAMMERVPIEPDRRQYRASFGLLLKVAAYDQNAHAQVDLRRALTERAIDEFLEFAYATATTATATTHRATLRRIRAFACPDVEPGKRAHQRVHVRAPYSDGYIQHLLTVCDADLSEPFRSRYRVVIALSAGAGAATGEILRVQAGDLHQHADKTWSVWLTKPDGQRRLVPIGGRYGTVIRDAAHGLNPSERLFWPECEDKRRYQWLTNAVKEHLGRESFVPGRGRLTWLLGLLHHAVPFVHVMQVAGINPGTHTPTDLLRYASPESVDRHALRTAVGT